MYLSIYPYYYNGALCAIALGGTDWKSCIWAMGAVILSTILQIIGMKLGITTLTAPFVVSVWIVIMIQKMISRRQNQQQQAEH